MVERQLKHADNSKVTVDDSLTQDEIEQYRRERAKIDRILDSIDSLKGGKRSRIADTALIAATVMLLFARFAFHWVDDALSLELGLILLSLKIVLLIRIQNNYNHFIFMIMHTIEHNQTGMDEKLGEIMTVLAESRDRRPPDAAA